MSNKITASDLERLITETFYKAEKPFVTVTGAGTVSKKNAKVPWIKKYLDDDSSRYAPPTNLSRNDYVREFLSISPSDKPKEGPLKLQFSPDDMSTAMKGRVGRGKVPAVDRGYYQNLVDFIINFYADELMKNEQEFETFRKWISKRSKGKADSLSTIKKGKISDEGFDWGIGVNPDKIRSHWMKVIDTKSIAPIDDIAATAGKEEKLETLDFAEILQDPKNPNYFWALSFVEALFMYVSKRSKDKPENLTTLQKIIKSIEASKTDVDNRALGKDKPIPSVPITSRTASRHAESTPEVLKTIFSNVFGPMDSIASLGPKIKIISDFSKSFVENKASGDPIELVMSKTIAFDYLRRIVVDYESSAGGFLFENFLALMTAGTKEGGNRRIEDFSFYSGRESDNLNLASAKLYGPSVSSFGGSANLIAETLKRSDVKGSTGANTEIIYILAKKGDSLGNISISRVDVTVVKFPDNVILLSTKATESARKDPEKAKKLAKKKNLEDTLTLNKKGEWISTNTGTSTWKLAWPKEVIGKINLTDAGQDIEKYNETISEVMNSTEEKLGEMFKALNNFKVESTKYFSILQDKDQKASSEKIDSFDVALESLKSLRSAAFASFDESGKNYKGIAKGKGKAALTKQADIAQATTGALQESKSDSVSIKKLIEESFKR